MPVTIKGSGGGSVTLDAGAAAADTTLTLPNTTGTILQSGTAVTVAQGGTGVTSTGAAGNVLFTTDGSTWSATQKIVAGTAQASTSGISIDFTSIPSWVKRITVMLNNVSTNGTSALVCQIGTSGGIVNSGYNSGASNIAAAVASTAYANGFGLNSGSVSSESLSGVITIAYMGSNLWSCGSFIGSSFPGTRVGGGSVTLSGTLDRVRIATNNGTDTFDAGSINILYE